MTSATMKRRTFLQSLATAATAAGVASGRAHAADPKAKNASPQVFELRSYQMRVGGQGKIVGDFLSEIYIPQVTKLGAGPVGAFTLTFGAQMPTIYLLTPFASLAAYGAAQEKLGELLAKEQSPAAKAFLAPPGTPPAYLRSQTELLQGFDTIPRLVLPAATAKKEPRIFELRIYDTPSEATLALKMEMFGPKLGELEIFKKNGLTHVLFARSLVGPRQPSFSYLLTFPDLAARDAAWKRFREDPAWIKLKATPGYLDADIMANTTDLILTPTAYSQI